MRRPPSAKLSAPIAIAARAAERDVAIGTLDGDGAREAIDARCEHDGGTGPQLADGVLQLGFGGDVDDLRFAGQRRGDHGRSSRRDQRDDHRKVKPETSSVLQHVAPAAQQVVYRAESLVN